MRTSREHLKQDHDLRDYQLVVSDEQLDEWHDHIHLKGYPSIDWTPEHNHGESREDLAYRVNAAEERARAQFEAALRWGRTAELLESDMRRRTR